MYERAVHEPNDLVGEVRCTVEYGMHDPRDSVEMVCAAKETTQAVVTALSSPCDSDGLPSAARQSCPPRPCPGSRRTSVTPWRLCSRCPRAAAALLAEQHDGSCYLGCEPHAPQCGQRIR